MRYKETRHAKYISEDIKKQADIFWEENTIPQLLCGYKLMIKGMRVSDACRTKLENIDWTNGCIKIMQLKTSFPLTVWLDTNTYEWLKAYCLIFRHDINTHLDYLCFSPYYRLDCPESAHIQESSFRAVWKKFRDIKGQNVPYYITSNGTRLYDLCNHVLKRRAVNIALDISSDIRVACAVAGHRNPATTLRYYASPAKPWQIKEISKEIT